MFRELPINVTVDQHITFHFPTPLSIEMLVVSNRADESLWEIVWGEYQVVEVEPEEGAVQYWPIEEAPAEILAQFAEVQARLERETRA